MFDLSIVILNYNTKKLTLDCLKSIYNNKWQKSIDVWVVDNASTDGSADTIKKSFPKVNVIKSKNNVGFSKGNNLGLKKAYKNSKHCLLLNSDTLVKPGSLDKLVDFADKEKFDIVSCKLLNTDGSFQPNGGDLPSFLPVFFWLSSLDGLTDSLPSFHQINERYFTNKEKVGWVSGSVMLVKSDVFKEIGFFDEKIFMYAEDVDFCWRADNNNFKVGWTDSASIVHIGGASSKKPKYKQWLGEFKGLIYLYDKHHGSFKKELLKLQIYFFTSLRVIAFYLIGNKEYAETYAKIIKNL